MPQQSSTRHSALARYACIHPEPNSRLHTHPESRRRHPFQRDCDRIVHSSAFRALMHKTQVFVAPIGGHYRTRLTHTIEVARVARALASSLGLNSDLAEAIALAHDLGHAPFGHVGETALSRLMNGFGGFEHNAQAIRIVTSLERSYLDFDGLNLTWETLEGIAKHNGPVREPVPEVLAVYNKSHDLELESWPSAEAQVAAVADDIAYNCHDLQDGLRAGLFTSDELSKLPLIGPIYRLLRQEYSAVSPERMDSEVMRRLFGTLTEDAVNESQRNFDSFRPLTVSDIRRAEIGLIRFSTQTSRKIVSIRDFLSTRMYQSMSVRQQCDQGTCAIKKLFGHYMENPLELPDERKADASRMNGPFSLARAVADHISGMTDRIALDESSRVSQR